MATGSYMTSPFGNCQNVEDLFLYPWQQDGMTDAATAFTPEDFMLYPNNYSNTGFEDWSKLDNLDFPLSSKPTSQESYLESPISTMSSRSAQDSADDMAFDASITGYDFDTELDTTYGPSDMAIPELQTCEPSALESKRDSPERGFLSPVEIQELYAIAMPDLTSSPETSSSTSSPEAEQEEKSPEPTEPRKRQQKGTKSKVPALSKGKTAHNMIEKRYRNNLNSKFEALRNCVPSIRGDQENAESDDGQEARRKTNKAKVITKAMEYIAELEEKNRICAEEYARIKSKLPMMERFSLKQHS